MHATLAQLSITVDDVTSATAFYRDVVGLQFLFDVPGQDMAFLQAGATRLYLARSSSPEFQSTPIMYLEVADIEAEVSRLKDAGVTFMTDPTPAHRDEQGTLWLSFFRTPWGLPTALMEVK